MIIFNNRQSLSSHKPFIIDKKEDLFMIYNNIRLNKRYFFACESDSSIYYGSGYVKSFKNDIIRIEFDRVCYYNITYPQAKVFRKNNKGDTVNIYLINAYRNISNLKINLIEYNCSFKEFLNYIKFKYDVTKKDQAHYKPFGVLSYSNFF